MGDIDGRLRVCIADGDPPALARVRDALLEAGDSDIVGVARSGPEVVPLVESLCPDLVLLELRMDGVDGVTCLREIQRRRPDIEVVMLSAAEDPEHIAGAMDAGAGAHVDTSAGPEELAAALRQVVGDVIYERSTDAGVGPGAVFGPRLTMRERAILETMAEGLDTKLVGAELCISEMTVRFHVARVCGKLGVHNGAAAMRRAYEHGLISTRPQSQLAPPNALSA